MLFKDYKQTEEYLTADVKDFYDTDGNELDIDNLEGWYSEPIVVPANGWVGFLADDEGRFQVDSIKNGDFKIVLE